MTSGIRRRDSFSRIGGHLALDLVNTVEWRLSAERFEEDLTDFEDVVRWGEQTDLLSPDEAEVVQSEAAERPADAVAEVERVRALREAVYAVAYEAADPASLRDEYLRAVQAGELRRLDDTWGWAFPVDLALPRRRMALEAFDLLTAADTTKLAQCQDAECGWVFLDTSPRRNRRWCVSADCGNRNRVRDFYDRTRAASGAN